MTGSPRPGHRMLTGRATLALAGAILALFLAAPSSLAQLTIGGQRNQDKNAPVVFQADEVQYDDQLALTVAKGHVEISQGGEVLLADTVSYNQRTDTITASGHVSLLEPTGEVTFADFMELRDSMNNVFAQNVRRLLADRSRLAANAARRINGNRFELRRGVYSPCDLCKNDPSAPPAWQFKAREISDDKELKLIEFRDAVLEIDGVPVLYTPYLSEPDPSVKRASGFLTPTLGNSNTNGFHVAIPYFWVIDADKDLTLAPRFTTRAGELLAGQYRQRFSNGMLDAIGSVNYSNVGSGSNTNTGNEMRGDINAYIFQPLVPGLGDSTQPIVLPVANRTWQSEPDGFGGVWKVNANLLDIVREVGTQTRRLSLGSEWDKTFRDGIGGEYKFSASLRGDGYSVSDLSPKSNPDLPSAFFPVNGAPPALRVPLSFFDARAFPQVGLTWSYPLAHRGEDMTAIIEPIAGVYAGPAGGNNRKIPNEDSLGFEFRDSDLFRPDRLAGYDLLDTGQRVDYGLKLALYNKAGGNYRMLIGQSYRAEANPFLPLASGAGTRLSDVVGRFVLSPSSYLDLIYRFRLDKSTLSNRTQEVGLNAGPQSLRVGVNYLLVPAQLQSQVVTNPVTGQNVLFGKRQQLSVTATTKLTRYWSLTGTETINLTNSTNVINGISTPQSSSTSIYATLAAVYQDECMAFISSVTQSGIRSGDVTPGVSVMFSVVFKNLGEIGGTLLSVAGNSL